MKIGVTGASGHLGNVLCRLLLEQGHVVTALYRSDTTALEGLPLRMEQGDVLVRADLDRFVKDQELVFHCAAKISIHGDPDGSVHRTNTDGVQNILSACIDGGVKKLIHVSSTHAVEELPHGTTMAEDRQYKQQGSFAYDFSKATGEQIMLKAFRDGEIEGCVVRPSSIVGPFDFKPSELGKALADMRAGKVPLLPPGGYNFVDVHDVAQAMMNAMDCGKNGEVYFLTGQYHSIKQIAAMVGECTGTRPPRSVMPYWLMRTMLPLVQAFAKITGAAPVFSRESIDALKNGHPNIDNSKAKWDLQLGTRPLRDTLRDHFSWVDQQ